MNLCAGHSSKWPGVLRTRIVLTVLAACFGPLLFAQEICDNGIDDDGNGLVDLNDTLACPCNLLPPPVNLITNGSFEDHNCCPNTRIHHGLSATSTAPTAGPTTGIRLQRLLHPCGLYRPAVFHSPIPDGNAVAGIRANDHWSGAKLSYEFLVQCLTAHLVNGETYEFSFNMAAVRSSMAPFNLNNTLPMDFGPIDMVIFGTRYLSIFPTPCNTTPFWATLARAILPHRTELAGAWPDNVQPGKCLAGIELHLPTSLWGGSDPVRACVPDTQDYNIVLTQWPYFLIDDFSLVTADVAVTRTGHPCTNDLVLTAAPLRRTAQHLPMVLGRRGHRGPNGSGAECIRLGSRWGHVCHACDPC